MDRCGPLVGARARRDPHHPTGDRDLLIDQKIQRIFPLLSRPRRQPLPEAEGFTWYDWGNPLESVGIQLDPSGVLVLIDDDRRFVLGRCPCAIEDHGYTPAIEPEPGDTTSITLDRGVASWPTPFHITCCGSLGGGSSWYPWARYLYWHLSWTKADGARLDMLARFQQNYESGSGWNDPGAASLVRLDIRPARRPGL